MPIIASAREMRETLLRSAKYLNQLLIHTFITKSKMDFSVQLLQLSSLLYSLTSGITYSLSNTLYIYCVPKGYARACVPLLAISYTSHRARSRSHLLRAVLDDSGLVGRTYTQKRMYVHTYRLICDVRERASARRTLRLRAMRTFECACSQGHLHLPQTDVLHRRKATAHISLARPASFVTYF